ncbi:hypothetical protein LTR95_006714 [Oleoguttula sp. CCFEE 5521]
MLLLCRNITLECKTLLEPPPLCNIVISSDDFATVSRSEDAQRQPAFSTVHIASAREVIVHIESVASCSTASLDNADLLDAVFATFRAIARTSKSELLTVKISDQSPAFRNTACEIIAARRYPGKIEFDVEAKGLSIGLLKMLVNLEK